MGLDAWFDTIISETVDWPALIVMGARSKPTVTGGPIVIGEVAFDSIIPIWFAEYSVNQKLPLESSALRREKAKPEVGITNSSIVPVVGSSRPILLPKCSTNQNRPCLSMEMVAGAVVL